MKLAFSDASQCDGRGKEFIGHFSVQRHFREKKTEF